MHEEYQYLNLLRKILDEGNDKDDRTGVGTYSIFGHQMRFDLREKFPILTTKKVYWKGVVEELLWFLRGETDSKILEDKNVNIWKANTTREFLDKRGLKHYDEGMGGAIYGHQIRNFNGTYWGKRDKEPESFELVKDGVDQLTNTVDLIKNDPNSRRIVMSLWNPEQIPYMSLPPCHGIAIQFYVANGELNCFMHQRSVDTFLGLPFNISSYSLLTCLLARICGLQPGEFIWSGGDVHIYKNHIKQVKEQLTRTPYEFPILNIKKELNSLGDVEKLKYEDLELIGYKSHSSIKAEMAI